MDRALIVEIAALYFPLFLAGCLLVKKRPSYREKSAIAISSTWNAAFLVLGNGVFQYLHCWEFLPREYAVLGIPVCFYLGWIVLWGVIAVLLLSYMRWFWVVILMLAFDLVFMPLLHPVLRLHEYWLLGEGVLVGIVLVPGILLAHFVIKDVRVGLRSGLISLAFVTAVLLVFPTLANPEFVVDLLLWLEQSSSWVVFSIAAILFFASLPALAGVVEFAREGKGTPIPFDPPKKLVETGVYSYIANPMQTSMVVVFALASIFWLNWVFAALCVVAVFYSEGIARWSESKDLVDRFGGNWLQYQQRIARWRLRGTPLFGAGVPSATLYYRARCGVCSEVASFFQKRTLVSLRVEDVRFFSGEQPKRITYVSATGQLRYGVDAIAAALQHIHLGWAFLGWLIQLPGVTQFLQCAMDASGAAPPKGKVLPKE